MYSGPNYDDLYQGYYPYVQPYNIQQLSTVYINRNFQPIKPSTVHVNPNFKRQIHINPNFQNANIHVNPSILKTSKLQSLISEKTVPNKLPEHSTRTVLATKNKLIRLPETKTLVKSKYKIVRSNKTEDVKGAQFQNNNNNQGFKCDKYKVINNKFKLNNNKFKLDNRKEIKKVFKSKFKLDRRSNSEKTLKSRFKLIRKSRLMQLDPQKDIIKQRKSNVFKTTDNVKLPRTVKIRGRVFKFSPNFEFLHLLHTSPNHYRRLTRIVIRGLVYIQKDGSTYVRSKTEGVSSRNVVKGSLNRVYVVWKDVIYGLMYFNFRKINQKVLKKDNMPCLIYRKTGKCDLFSKGCCIKQHKPEEISVCIRFLQGACVKPKCLLSHKVSPDKLPTCKFYLEGSCSKDDCQYLHVKLSRTAEICKDFLQGFCKNGRDCDKRHQFICPDFEKLGKCRKKSCLYPHGNTVRRYKFTLLNKIARSKKVVEKKVIKTEGDKEQVENNVETVRYYLTDCKGETEVEGKGLSERAKLGSLPEFIPLS